MDWAAVAMELAERSGVAALLVGSAGELLMISPTAQRALGVASGSCERDWFLTHLGFESNHRAREDLRGLLAGGPRKVDLKLRTAQGPATVTFDASHIGGEHGGTLLVLEQRRMVASEPRANDYDYEVEGVSEGHFRLRMASQQSSDSCGAEARCFEVLHGLSRPCECCPLLGEALGEGGLVASAHASHGYVVTSAVIREDVARVSVRHVSGSSLAALLRARLEELGSRASLSKRERSVFEQLMCGRSVTAIAEVLGITARTVKFHQANLLQKLGADSRVDLLRLLF